MIGNASLERGECPSWFAMNNEGTAEGLRWNFGKSPVTFPIETSSGAQRVAVVKTYTIGTSSTKTKLQA